MVGGIVLALPGTAAAASMTVTPATTPTPTDNDYTRIAAAIGQVADGNVITLDGTFNWTEPNAATSWAKGNDGSAGTTTDNYSVLLPPNVPNVTVQGSVAGGTIQGPGDLANVNLEGVFFADGGDNQNWTIRKLRLLDFDLAIGFFNGAGGSDAFQDVDIKDNFIRLPKDLNATVAPADSNQNIGIHFSFGKNQTISGNTIELAGDGVSAGANSSSEVGMQSNTSGGDAYDGLQVTDNVIDVKNAQSANPERILGIWENGHAHTSDIAVSGNEFKNSAAGNDPALNVQRAFRVTSHSGGTSTVRYENNKVTGANIGFE